MNFKRLTLIIILQILFINLTFADVVTTGKVVKVGTYGDGLLFVKLDQQILEPGCNHYRFDVDSGHGQIKSWLSIAMTAMASGREVVVGTNGCLNGRPTLDATTSSFFHIQ